MAALLAEQDFVANQQFLTAPDGGLYPTYCGGGRPEEAVAGLGDRWELEQIGLRLWPSSARTQGIITAMFDLVQKHDLTPERVKSVDVALGKEAFELHGGFSTFNGKFEAMLSAHYAAAAVLFDRRFWLDQFEPARYGDPSIRRFTAEQVRVRASGDLTGAQAEIEATLVDGTRVSTRCTVPKGASENPVTRKEIEGKFRLAASKVLAPNAAEHAIGVVEKLEELASVAELLTLLRV